MEDLLEGLDCLSAKPAKHLVEEAQGSPVSWKALVGDADPLLEAPKVASSIRGCVVVPGAGHAPGTLINELKGFLDAI
jgi:hypothetical protein